VKTSISQVEFYIMIAKTLFLLSLTDIDALSVYFNNLINILVTLQGNIPVIQQFSHSFLI
jgi:hypothetical protein